MIHPDYVGTPESRVLCCEAGPEHQTLDGPVMFACTRRPGHRGDHGATLPGNVVVETWENTDPTPRWRRRHRR